MYFQRRRGGQLVVYYRTAEGVLKTVPRDDVRALDGEPDHNVKAWIDEHQGQYERLSTPSRGLELADSNLTAWVEEWVKFRLKRGHGSKNTRTRAAHALLVDVIPYFLSKKPALTDPDKWPPVSFGLVDWQERKGVTEANRIHSRTALRKFWKWLGDTRKIRPGLDLPLDITRRKGQPTTLQYTPTPDEVLAVVGALPDVRIRLLLLLGYFASLRPQETLALRRADFIAGAAAEKLQCCVVMEKAGRFNKLAVNIHQQQRQDGTLEPPKAFSKGLAAIWDERAALLIREILLIRDLDAPLFDYSPNWNARLWKAAIKKQGTLTGITLHDLRKASLYWLGHHGGIDLIPLKNHARHSKVETTMLYCRRPKETPDGGNQDLAW